MDVPSPYGPLTGTGRTRGRTSSAPITVAGDLSSHPQPRLVPLAKTLLEARPDKPITKLRTTITNQEGTVVQDGSALVYAETL